MSMRVYTKAFEADGSHKGTLKGNRVAIIEATDPVDVEFLDYGGQVIAKAEGMEIGFSGGPKESFYSVRVTSATAQTVKYAITDGDFQLMKIAGTVDVNSASSVAAGEVEVNAAAVQIVAARSGRKHLTILNNGANAVAIGPAGVAFADGLLLAVGQSLTVDECGGAYYAIAAGATAEDLRFMESY